MRLVIVEASDGVTCVISNNDDDSAQEENSCQKEKVSLGSFRLRS